jgi:uncharacterized protein YbjT (DUF2867 family)
MILVLGASGNVGSQVVSKLGRLGRPARALFHSAAKAEQAQLPGGIEPVVVDVKDGDSLQRALSGVEKVFIVSPAGPESAGLVGAVVEAARRAGVKHLVKSSIFPATESYTFGRAHVESERRVTASGLTYTLLRPNAFMQNFINFFAYTIKTQGAFYLPARDARVSHIDIRDVAEVAAKVLTETGHENRAYELTGPEALSYAEAAARLGAVIGKRVSYVDVAPGDFKKSMLGYGAPEWLIDAMIDYEDLSARGAAELVTDTFERLCGRKPTSFDQFVHDHRDAFVQS